jgi:hypothetical protein
MLPRGCAAGRGAHATVRRCDLIFNPCGIPSVCRW